nr:unnamed protein product [Spirometra erinaceieuropaei]
MEKKICGSSRLLAPRLCHAAVLSASHSMSIRSWAARVLEANQRCPHFDWLATWRQRRTHTRAVTTPRRRTRTTACLERARGNCLQSPCVRTFSEYIEHVLFLDQPPKPTHVIIRGKNFPREHTVSIATFEKCRRPKAFNSGEPSIWWSTTKTTDSKVSIDVVNDAFGHSGIHPRQMDIVLPIEAKRQVPARVISTPSTNIAGADRSRPTSPDPVLNQHHHPNCCLPDRSCSSPYGVQGDDLPHRR